MARSKAKPAIPENHPVAQAVAPLRAAAVAIATARAEAFLAKMKGRIDAETNVEIIAPYPDSDKVNRRDYLAALAYRGIALQLVEPAAKAYWLDQTTYVWSVEGAKAYLAEQVAHAAHNYVVFVLKLIAKVEAEGARAIEASFVGTDDAWTESELTVTLSDGASHVWRTKQIWNTSVYGKVFAQYPTRIVKAKKAKK